MFTEEERAAGALVPRGEGKKSRGKATLVATVIRRFLECSKEVTLREDPNRRTRLLRMVENMVNLASGRSPNSVAAFNALMDRAYGKARPHDDALNAVSQGGLQIVYLNPPQLEGEVKESTAQPAPRPEFIDGEVVHE